MAVIAMTQEMATLGKEVATFFVDGTGVYTGLLGQGAESGIRDYGAQSLDATLTGQVH